MTRPVRRAGTGRGVPATRRGAPADTRAYRATDWVAAVRKQLAGLRAVLGGVGERGVPQFVQRPRVGRHAGRGVGEPGGSLAVAEPGPAGRLVDVGAGQRGPGAAVSQEQRPGRASR
jgi:hypothetical protein